MPVSDALVDITFTRAGLTVIDSLASYNSTSGTYFAAFESASFGAADIYTYTITVTRTGYNSKISVGAVNLQWRPVTIQFSSDGYDSTRGLFGGDSTAYVEVILTDTLNGSPLTGANVSYNWHYGSGQFTESDNGIYWAKVYASGSVPVDVYVLTVSASKSEYQGNTMTANMKVDFAGGHVVLPIVGVVPLSMFAIILGAVAVAGGIGGLRAYVWATTPYIIKQINKALRAVQKGTSAEPVPELRTRVGTPLLLLSAELESAGISLEKAVVPAIEVTEEVEPEEVEAEVTEVQAEKTKRGAEKAEGKAEEPEAKEEPAAADVKPEKLVDREPDVKTEDLQFEPEELELGSEQVEAEVKEPEAKTEEPETDAMKERVSEESQEDFEQKASEDEETSEEEKSDEGRN
jgi:hypothetical protein